MRADGRRGDAESLCGLAIGPVTRVDEPHDLALHRRQGCKRGGKTGFDLGQPIRVDRRQVGFATPTSTCVDGDAVQVAVGVGEGRHPVAVFPRPGERLGDGVGRLLDPDRGRQRSPQAPIGLLEEHVNRRAVGHLVDESPPRRVRATAAEGFLDAVAEAVATSGRRPPTLGPVSTEPPPDHQTVLIRVTGPDHSGVTAGLMSVLADAGAQVQDIEQIVIRGQLTLGVAVAVPEGRDLLREVLLFGWDQGMEVDFDVVSSIPTPKVRGHVVTILGRELTPSEIGAATRAIADAGANIDRIIRLSRYPVMSYELLTRDGDDEKLRSNLLQTAAANPGIDVAIQREGLGRRAKRLVVLDVDSTLIQDEVIDLLAAEAGCLEEVRKITQDAMEGGIDFESSLRMRVRLLGGLDEGAIDRAWSNLTYTPGARTFVRTLRRLGYTVAIVSGGFTAFTDRLAADLGVHHAHANVLEIVDGRLTGELDGPIVDRERKATLLREIAAAGHVPLSQTVAVGDGANDLDMLSAAGLGIAFNAKPVVEEVADTALTVPYLDAILFVLGIRREDVEEADELDGPAIG